MLPFGQLINKRTAGAVIAQKILFLLTYCIFGQPININD